MRAGLCLALVALLMAGCASEPVVTTIAAYNEGSSLERIHVTLTEEDGDLAEDIIFPLGPLVAEDKQIRTKSRGPFTVEAFTESGLRAPEKAQNVTIRGHILLVFVNDTAMRMEAVKTGG